MGKRHGKRDGGGVDCWGEGGVKEGRPLMPAKNIQIALLKAFGHVGHSTVIVNFHLHLYRV